MHSQCSVCKQNIEPGTYHEAINYPDQYECRVKETGTGLPLYNLKRNGTGKWGPE